MQWLITNSFFYLFELKLSNTFFTSYKVLCSAYCSKLWIFAFTYRDIKIINYIIYQTVELKFIKIKVFDK